MNILKYSKAIFLFVLISLLWACNQKTQWEGQEPVKKVSTRTVPIQLQHKGVFDLGNGVFCSNNFNGARLNGITLTEDTLITVLITSENTPINMSPWYSFKIWSDTIQEIFLKLSYTDGVFHRYFPKLSRDGLNWQKLDSTKYEETLITIGENRQAPTDATMHLSIDPDTLWVSAQELITSSQTDSWTSKIESNSFATKAKIGESHEGRAINLLKIGESDDKQIIVVLSRQHPPEVAGFLAMQAFVETICSENKTAKDFRSKYNTYVVPVVNPDGVENGHWRHNRGGVDLNRDWQDFNQPETSAIRNFIKQKIDSTGGKLIFFIDFHSTWEDIYYTMKFEEGKGNMPGLVDKMIDLTDQEFPDYKPNIKPSSVNKKHSITSNGYFATTYGAEALTYEVGDNTPRDFIRKKAEVSATKLMELLIK